MIFAALSHTGARWLTGAFTLFLFIIFFFFWGSSVRQGWGSLQNDLIFAALSHTGARWLTGAFTLFFFFLGGGGSSVRQGWGSLPPFRYATAFDTKFAKIKPSVVRSYNVFYSHIGTKFTQNLHFAYVCVQNTWKLLIFLKCTKTVFILSLGSFA